MSPFLNAFTSRFGLPFVALIFMSSVLSAEEPALIEFLPDGASPNAAQRELIMEAAAKVRGCRVEYDAEGNVVGLQLSNHNADRPRDLTEEQKKQLESRSGLDDATFVALGELPELKALALRKQPLSAEAFAVLENWPDLEVFRIERDDWGDDNADFMLHLNKVPNLKWLELKHLFGLDDTRVDELNGFPNLVRLELDNASAQEECLPFLERCPNLKDFELHRTRMTNEQIMRMIQSLPNIERLDIKQHHAKELDARCLAPLKDSNHLRVFVFNRWKDDQIFWENGVEHLAEVPSLKKLGAPWEHPAIVKLLEVRPDIEKKDGRDYAVPFDEYKAMSR